MVTGATKEVIVGCEPQVRVFLGESSGGTLLIRVEAIDPANTDLDAFFFDFADPSVVPTVGTFAPSPTTSVSYDPAGNINALTDGSTLQDSYDARVEFGTGDTGTEGDVDDVGFTIWLYPSDGPLTIDSLDHDSFSVVVNTDSPEGGLVLTTGAGGDDGGDQEPIIKTVSEDFDDIRKAEDSDLIESDDGWRVWKDQLFTNGRKDGELKFETVESDGPVSISFDAKAHGIQNFEATGWAADSLRIEVQIDGGDWVLLDEFVVNDDGTALVGSETGQEITADYGEIDYSGGILDTVTETADFRFVSDISAHDERILIDNVDITSTEDAGEDDDCDDDQSTFEQVVAQDIDFDHVRAPVREDDIASDDNWGVRHDMAFTNGSKDGELKLEEVQTDGPVSFAFKAMASNIQEFEAGDAWYSDSLFVQVQIDGGEWVTLDEFQVNGDETALVGSESGQEITGSMSELSYSGGLLDTALDSVQFRLVSDISANNEKIFIDDMQVTVTEEIPGEPGDCDDCEDFGDAAAGDIVSDQFAGFSVVGQRAGDDENSANDAMIFDTANPTGQDDDLAYDDQGNAIILSEDGDSSDPDDNAGGGTLTFTFEALSDVQSITLLDIEEDGGSIDLYDAEGELIDSRAIPGVGDNSVQEIDLGASGVSSMVVTLVGSGAVDDLCFTTSDGDDDCEMMQYLLNGAVDPDRDDDRDVTDAMDDLYEAA